MYEKLDRTRHATQLVQNRLQVVMFFLELFIAYINKVFAQTTYVIKQDICKSVTSYKHIKL